MPRIIAIASVFENAPLVGHFIDHYRGLGVDHIILCAKPEFLEALSTHADGVHPIDAARENEDLDSRKDRNEREALEKYVRHWGYTQEDYKLCLDIDEFHEYPLPLPALARQMQAIREWALCGHFVDRFGDRYSTPAIASDRSLFDQFPLPDRSFSESCGACTRKVMICEIHCQHAPGRHHLVTHFYEGRWDTGHWDRRANLNLRVEDFHVHHFKWSQGVEDRLKAKIADPTCRDDYREESKKAMKLLAESQRTANNSGS